MFDSNKKRKDRCTTEFKIYHTKETDGKVRIEVGKKNVNKYRRYDDMIALTGRKLG